jgi:hypothetical protein
MLLRQREYIYVILGDGCSYNRVYYEETKRETREREYLYMSVGVMRD